MISHAFHTWERRLASIDTTRLVRPFEWGLDWLGLPPDPDPLAAVKRWSSDSLADSDRFYTAPPTTDYDLSADDVLRFPSAIDTPYAVNNTVVARVFRPEARRSGARRAVIVLPQWNANGRGHVGLCRLFARFGLTAVRLSLPYHDERALT